MFTGHESKSNGKRSRRVLTTIAVCLLASCVVASGASAATQAQKGAGAPTASQFKKLKKQVRKLKKQLAGISASSGAVGAQGEQGPQGAPGAAGPATGPAGGDLTGTFPDPQIAPLVIGNAELAGNAITSDTSIINTALGNLSNKIGAGAIGRSEIGDGQVQSDELGEITTASEQVWVDAGQYGSATVTCPNGTQMLSGGGLFSTGVSPLYETRAFENGWTVSGVNKHSQADRLFVEAYCLD